VLRCPPKLTHLLPAIAPWGLLNGRTQGVGTCCCCCCVLLVGGAAAPPTGCAMSTLPVRGSWDRPDSSPSRNLLSTAA